MKFLAYGNEGRPKHFNATLMRPEDERPHPVPPGAGFAWAETNMFGFNIPEHAIDCLIWFIYRPKLGVTFGGVTIWQGIKQHYLEAEVFDLRAALPLPADNTNWDCPNGLSIRMIEPLQTFSISYRQPGGDVKFDLVLDACMPPAFRYNGNHVTQAMRTRGRLTMGGAEYTIHGHYARDRSWGEERHEAPMDVPPLGWIAGIFGDDFAFHLTAFESSNRRPEWAGLYAAPAPGEHLLWGYVWDAGELLGVDQLDLYIDRRNSITTAGASIMLTASNGAAYHIEGQVIALTPAIGWPNIATNYALTEWRCRGRIGWGDIQDVTFGAHYRSLARLRAVAAA